MSDPKLEAKAKEWLDRYERDEFHLDLVSLTALLEEVQKEQTATRRVGEMKGGAMIEPRPWPQPIFTDEEVWRMKRDLREVFGAAAVDDLPLLDLWGLWWQSREES